MLAASPAFAFPPFFITSPPTTAVERQPYSYTFTAIDLDLEAVTYGAPVLPPFLTFNGVNTISGTPLASQIGAHKVTITVSDRSTTTQQSFVIVVSNVEDPPQLLSQIAPDPQNAAEDQPYSFSVAPFFTDPDGDPITFGASALPERLSIDAATGVISGVPRGPRRGELGSYGITVTAANAGGSASDSFTLIINSENDAPVIPEPVPTLSTPEDTPLDITAALLRVQDEDDDAFTVLVTPPGPNDKFALANDGTRLQPATDYHGSLQIQVRVRDPGGALSNTVRATVTVTPQNDAPRGRPIPTQTLTESTAFSLALAEYYTDVENDRLSYQATGLPAWLTLDGSSGVIAGTPPSGVEAGELTVDVTVSDGNASSRQQFKTTVLRLGRADLVAVASVAPTPSLLANPATWTLAVQNNSDVDAGNVALETVFTGNAPVSFAAPTGSACTTQTSANQTRVSCRFAPVAARATASVTIAGTASQTGVVHASTEVTIVDRAPIDPAPENNRASVTLSIAESLSSGAAQRLPVNDARAVAIGDLNGDKFADLAVATAGGAGALAFLNVVDPASSTKRAFAATPLALGDTAPGNGIALADLDMDGDVDVVTANAAGQTNKVLINSGTGTFTAIALAPNADASNAVALGDLDGDGRVDIVFANDNSSVVHMNRGAAGFARAQELTGPDSRDAALVNLVGDPLPELVLANTDGDATVYANTRGRLQPAVTLPTGPTTSVVAVDLDKDGDVDLVFGREAPGAAMAPQDLVFANTSTATASFSRSADLVGVSTIDAVTADLELDGDPDVISISRSGGHRIYANDGVAHFTLYAQQFVHAGAIAAAAGLLSVDDRLDLAVAGSTAIGVFVNDRKGNLGAGDSGAPTVQLVGEPRMSLDVGGAYKDAGATATDDVDGDLTARLVVKNPVDTAVVGTYSVTYDVTDSSGNAAPTATRTVEVRAKTGTGGGGGGAVGAEVVMLLVLVLSAIPRGLFALAPRRRRSSHVSHRIYGAPRAQNFEV